MDNAPNDVSDVSGSLGTTTPLHTQPPPQTQPPPEAPSTENKVVGGKRKAGRAAVWSHAKKVNKLVFLGHILNPCYKFQMIGMHLGDMGMNDVKVQLFIKDIENCLMDLYNTYKGDSSIVPPCEDEGGDEEQDLMEKFRDDPAKLKYHKQMIEVRKAQNQAVISNEVDKYLADPYVKWSPSFNVLEWWKGNTTAFPILSKVAKDIFAIPSSTVASESAFSLGRRIVDPFRASLQPKMVEALVCCNDWLRGEELNLYKEPTEEELEFYQDCEEVVITHTQEMHPPQG